MTNGGDYRGAESMLSRKIGSCVTTVRDGVPWPHGCVLQAGQRTLFTKDKHDKKAQALIPHKRAKVELMYSRLRRPQLLVVPQTQGLNR
jgi:hypothetical protein